MSTSTNNVTDSLQRQFETARRELLELKISNRLLNTPRDTTSGAGIEIKEESSQAVFRMLVFEGKSLRFEEGQLIEEPISAEESGSESGREEGAAEKAAPRTRKRRVVSRKQQVLVDDDILHTILDPDELDRRLNRLVTDSSAIMQEQGVNVLFLATGFLRWFEAGHPDRPRYAPLILIPVKLNRARGGGKYSLELSGDELGTNITLKMRLASDFGVVLPELPELDSADPLYTDIYFKSVEEAIAGQPGWGVLPNEMVLWFYSFSKLLMYRDLEASHWPSDYPLAERPLVKSLLQEGFAPSPPLAGDESVIDSLFPPRTTLHVIDSDSSQSLVVEESLKGRSLVIQGPPGTGKSQTITNLIAAAVADNRKVLFVAEKMAALEVVQRRLDNIGLGGAVLELHSHKTNKRQVLQEIENSLKLGVPLVPAELDSVVEGLSERQQLLNRYYEILHRPFRVDPSPSEQSTAEENPGTVATSPELDNKSETSEFFTPYEIFASLIDLRLQQVPLPDFQLTHAAAWTKEDFQTKLKAVNELVGNIHQMGDPQAHPWRGSELDSIIPLDLERIVATAPQRVEELRVLQEKAAELAARFSLSAPRNLLEIFQLQNALEAIGSAPVLDPQPLAGTAWQDHRQQIQQMAQHAARVLAVQEKLRPIVRESAWDQDLEPHRMAYQQHGRKFFRMFYSSYRQARKSLRGCLQGRQPKTFEDRLEILNQLSSCRSSLKFLTENQIVGERGFGKFWLGPQTQWGQIVDWEKWDAAAFQRGVPESFRPMVSQYQELEGIRTQSADLIKSWNQTLISLKTLFQSLRLNPQQAFSPEQADPGQAVSFEEELVWLGHGLYVPLPELSERILAWQEHPHRLQQWQVYRRSMVELESLAEGELVRQIASRSIVGEQLSGVFRFAFAEGVLREMMRKYPELKSFQRSQFEKTIDEFCDLDIRRIELARAQIAKAHWDGIGQSEDPNLRDAVGLLRHEMQKQRRHLPLRELLKRAGTAIQDVKPVFMMSPISVAQYLEPGVLEFDLLLIDEASQVRPVDALGAAARCCQMIVVGDDKQMPPSQFFGRVVGEIEEEDDSEMQAGDVESILGLAIARNMPQRMLRWHYRSKHESLIAVSNREFYDNQLYVIPSPQQRGELGVQWQFVEQGRFLKGRNQPEAEVVAKAIMQHAKEHPQLTLGVAAFSITQRDAIIASLNKLRREDHGCEAFFDPALPDPFFVKNLENVQGDERDVIFVSVGYGPGEDGRVLMNFGPVSNLGGERRLNVLMTRAKQVLRIFSSINPEDVDLSRATGRGPAVMREYLRYARDRARELSDRPNGSSNPAGSPANLQSRPSGGLVADPLAAVIKRELEGAGWQVAQSVGIAGIYVDLAVQDPDQPGRYFLGISLDGKNAASLRSARDRNRTMDGVLGGQGWVIHHVWSPEFFREPQVQIKQILDKIEWARQGKLQPPKVRLASSRSQINRNTSVSDPLAVIMGEGKEAGPAPRRSTRKSQSAASSDSAAAGQSKPGSILSRINWSAMWLGFTGALAVVLQAAQAALNAKPGQKKDAFLKVLLSGKKKPPATRRKK
jgi:hypothetical protein